MGKLLCEKKLRDVWCRNESVRAEIGNILHTHTHTHAAKLVVEIIRNSNEEKCKDLGCHDHGLKADRKLFFF